MTTVDTCPNKYNFPHWDKLYKHQMEKANLLSLSEKDFRDYDPQIVALMKGKDSGYEYVYSQPIYVMQEVLAYQSQQSVDGRFFAWTATVPGFWAGLAVGLIFVLLFTWSWDHCCPMWPAGLSEHEIEIQNIANRYYYSSWAEHNIPQFWMSLLFFVWGFAAGRRGWAGDQ